MYIKSVRLCLIAKILGKHNIEQIIKKVQLQFQNENLVYTTVAASLLGHTAEVNEQYYTFDVTDLEYKIKVVENIEAV